jgi:CRP/FNR family transcriptional regulator, cyclic AMP receptor protein
MTTGTLAPVGLGESLRRLIRSESLCASTIEVGRREVVYSCLDGDRSIYLVERGQVKAVAPSRDGKECLLGIYTAGDVFGEPCLLGGNRMETVIAMAPTLLRRISAVRVLSALSDAGLHGGHW